MILNVSKTCSSFYCLVLMFVAINCQSTNKLSSFYEDWIGDVSRSNDGNKCQDCFQWMAGSLAEQLMSIKEEALEDAIVLNRLRGFQTAYANLRDIVRSGILNANDSTYNTSSTEVLVGASGATGATGATGPTGEIGPPGIVGVPGMPGIPGQAGPTGLGGMQGYTGATGPSGGQGQYGSTGATGDTGASGPAGNPGNQGASGPTGPFGPPGAPGPPGKL